MTEPTVNLDKVIHSLDQRRQQVQGDKVNELEQAINKALDRIPEGWNIEL
jgi:hypothetical protein